MCSDVGITEASPDADIVVVAQYTSSAAVDTVALDEKAIRSTRTLSLDGILPFALGATVQTNSRGESLVYFRGAGERQTAVFFAGAPVNVPWDNRFSLSQIPTAGIGEIRITPGAGSTLYGLNTAGGIVDIGPKSAGQKQLDLELQAGDAQQRYGSVVVGNGPFLAAAAHDDRAGQPLSADASLPFNKSDDDLRLNTDLRQTSGLLHVTPTADGALEVTGTLLASNKAFGSAPEGRFAAPGETARYWRYPDTDHLLGVVNAAVDATPEVRLKATLWKQSFSQEIESYTDATYTALDQIQADEDNTTGLRLAAIRGGTKHSLRAAATIVGSSHDEERTVLLAEGDSTNAFTFRQRTYSVAVENEHLLGDWRLRVGAGLDAIDGSDASGSLTEESLLASAWYEPQARWSFGIQIANKPRFPTPRERFDDGLGRFVINPDLKAERSLQLEGTARYARQGSLIRVTPFWVRTRDTIDQILTETSDGTLRTRINLEGTRAFGAEIVGSTTVSPRLVASGTLTALHLRDVGRDKPLAERPDLLANGAVDFQATDQLRLRAELLHRGRAFAITGQETQRLELPKSTQLNVEAAWAPAALKSNRRAELYVRVDNVSDGLSEPVLGLPEPGRWLRAGVRISQ